MLGGLALGALACAGVERDGDRAPAGGSQAAQAPAALPGARLASVFPVADPNALAVDAAQTRLYLGEGASVAVFALDAAGPGELDDAALLARIPVDATILDLEPLAGHLWVAGGSQGLLRVAVLARARRAEPSASGASGEAARVETVDAPAGLTCLGLARAGGRVLATFGARAGSELRVYDAASGARLHALALPPGTPWAVAARDRTAWVALGEGGVARVELDARPPRVRAGPAGPGRFPPPQGFSLRAGSVRDVAVSATRVWLAADGAGLVAIDRAAPWSPDVPLEVTPLTLRGRVTYACRVACTDLADGSELVAVGTNLAPVEATDGAPYAATGWMDAELRIGGVTLGDVPLGSGEGLLVFRRPADGELELLVADARDRQGWRGLALRGPRVYEQHIGAGTVVRALRGRTGEAVRALAERAEGVELVPLATRRPRGFSGIDGVTSLGDPALVLFGCDPAGSMPPGWLRIGADDALEVVPGTARLAPLGLAPQARWIDPAAGDEWCLSGDGDGWVLARVDAARPERSARWRVRPPATAGGAGRTYFLGTYERGRLLLTRALSTDGLLVADAAALVAAARGAAPESTLELGPAQVVETHPGGAPERSRSWRTRVFDARDGRRIAIAALGFDSDPASTTFERARIALWDATGLARDATGLAAGGAGAGLRPLARAHGARAPGHAMAVEVARSGARDLAFVADFAGALLVLDVTRPEAPRLVAEWRAPPSPFDGRPDHALDLALERAADGRLVAWVAGGRRGLLRFDASAPERRLEPDLVVDTPGWAAGVHAGHDARGRFLLVGDQKAGLRLYR